MIDHPGAGEVPNRPDRFSYLPGWVAKIGSQRYEGFLRHQFPFGGSV
jgi:hypothetical protein